MWFDKARDLGICAVFVFLLWAPLGRWAGMRLVRGTNAPCQSIAIALGLGAWCLWILLLGVFGLLYRSLLLISAVGFFLALRLHRHVMPPEMRSGVSLEGREWLPLGVMAGIGLTYFVLVTGSTLAPEVAFDSLNVHLPYARDAALSHRVTFEPNNWSSVMPALPLMSYITAFLFSGVTLAKLFNLVCYAASAGVIYSYARRWWNRKVASAAALLFLSCPLALYEATTALIDLPLTLFCGLAVLALLEWTRGSELVMLRLSAVSLGFALGCKYHAAFWLAPAVLLIVFHSTVRRRQGLKHTLRLLLQYLTIVLMLYLPWLYRTWHYTGNPVFPAANWLFKSPYFTPQMEAAARAAYANEGVGVSVRELVRLPWTVTFHPGPFRGTLGMVLSAGVALALVRRMSQPVGYGLVLAGCYFYAWALTAQEIRYLLPLVPLISFLAAVGLIGEQQPGVAAPRNGSRWPWRLRPVAGYAGLVVLVAGSLLAFPSWYPKAVKEWTYWHSYQSPFPYLLGRMTAQDYVRRDVPSIDVYDYVNSHLGTGDRILLLNDAARFYSQVPTLYSFTVEAETFLLQEKEEAVVAGLKSSGITHVLLNYNGIAPLPGIAPRLGVYFFLDRQFQQRQLEPVYSSNNVVLYRVRKNPEVHEENRTHPGLQ